MLALPLSAAAAERDVPTTGPVSSPVGIEDIHDTVIQGRAGVAARAAEVRAPVHYYNTADGNRVQVAVSTSYPPNAAADEKLVEFLGSRLHGSELGGLSVYVGTPTEIERLCGGAGAVACYSPDESRMYVPGEDVGDIPVEYPLTHEYGHHIATWRSNDPWEAVDWGAKYWASAVRVCSYVEKGKLFPGDQGRHYRDDPGEGFADSYAHLHYPDVPWRYSAFMRPGQAEFAAIRRDVLHPWSGPRTRTFRARLGPGRETRTFRLRMRLDGDVTLGLAASRGMKTSIHAETRGFALDSTLRGGQSVGLEWCRHSPVEQVTLTVRRRAGAGPFALTVRYPG